MKKAKLFGLGAVALSAGLLLGACGNGGDSDSTDSTGGGSSSKTTTAALITDTGGVDDRSFNQSAWEGLEAWGKDHDLSRGNDGFQYFQSSNESDYIPNIDQALNAGFKTIFGIGYKLKPAIEEQAGSNPETNFAIIDDVIEGKDNVVSATFKDNEASYLAGIAAAYTTETNIVGFIGGVKGEVIDRFDAGFKAGVDAGAKALNKEVKVLNQYAGDFSAPDKGRSIAQGMYAQNADIIFHASGGTGNGVFQEAKSLNESGDKKVWVIGVDRDQSDEGDYTLNGEKKNFTLTSTLKGVGTVVEDLAQKSADGKFPGGEHTVYGLKEDGVGITEGQLSDEAKKAVNEAKEKIISGDIKVPETPKS
ncbi:BMP family ABC transporter substrate-binding protein [Enterococcus durans]|uniref:BMP family ABC transporter substrate-binding protein n=1 Tax=Enterococcus durans TaxID=53345 RepID=A0A5N0YVH0_9ENTE|nr:MULTISPECIES: BMP family protein [Enterococcus]KAA9178023.1 BMP family ABC transporter substrate-binding protein [Enterococcus durans]KAA9184338.1 BMP family ABC transporter substrate-binding protein [Enterococcus durans]KAA9185413.1 BMP family ABC transporter substrate-binding protein [Enterococcus durans]KAA9189671.1 BMP family ABC transporter substrate-binding protein [Enterococcus durans]KAA9192201.1 BMP family ABC transporter substrate-binding protein [Enterococcus durans]